MVRVGVYIKKLIDDGALVEDFTTDLLGIYPLKECLEREKELAKTSLFPAGLNGNAGDAILMTDEVREKMSDKSKKNNRERVENNTHNFLGGEIARKNAIKRVENETHHLLGKGKFNVYDKEDQKIIRIHKDLYHSNNDRYLNLNSKEYKQIKQTQLEGNKQ